MALLYHIGVHLVIHLIAMYIGSPTYVDRTMAKKTEYRTNVVSITHSTGCMILCTWGCFFVCGEGKNVFNDDQCINTVRYVHVWALLHTCSYFILDAWILCFVVKGFAPLDLQTYAHHLILALTFYQTLFFMDYMCVFGVMLLYMEISTIFMNMRTLLFHHGMQNTLGYAINSLAFFFAFMARVVYQFYICFWIGIELLIDEYGRKKLSFYKFTVITEMAIMVILSLILNTYWAWLCIQMFIRVVRRQLATEAKDPSETVELVRADALDIERKREGESRHGEWDTKEARL